MSISINDTEDSSTFDFSLPLTIFAHLEDSKMKTEPEYFQVHNPINQFLIIILVVFFILSILLTFILQD